MGAVTFTQWGLPTDRLVPADYDGDKKDDLAVYRASDGAWFIRRSTDGGYDAYGFGLPSDVPVPGNYDADNKADIGVYRDGVWYLFRSTEGFGVGNFGLSTDVPVPNRYLP